MSNSGYEILQFSICDGWVNNLYDGKDKPYILLHLKKQSLNYKKNSMNGMLKLRLVNETRTKDMIFARFKFYAMQLVWCMHLI